MQPLSIEPCHGDATVAAPLQDNGLKLSNSWSGYHIILNPDFSANVQWRFVNRAIDEVENQRVSLLAFPCQESMGLVTCDVIAQTRAREHFSTAS